MAALGKKHYYRATIIVIMVYVHLWPRKQVTTSSLVHRTQPLPCLCITYSSSPSTLGFRVAIGGEYIESGNWR